VPDKRPIINEQSVTDSISSGRKHPYATDGSSKSSSAPSKRTKTGVSQVAQVKSSVARPGPISEAQRTPLHSGIEMREPVVKVEPIEASSFPVALKSIKLEPV